VTDDDLPPLEPKPPSRLARRLRFLSGAQLLIIVFVLILLVPLLLAVLLNPLINLLSRG
jgi:hypothetical protein